MCFQPARKQRSAGRNRSKSHFYLLRPQSLVVVAIITVALLLLLPYLVDCWHRCVARCVSDAFCCVAVGDRPQHYAAWLHAVGSFIYVCACVYVWARVVKTSTYQYIYIYKQVDLHIFICVCHKVLVVVICIIFPNVSIFTLAGLPQPKNW